MTIQVDLTRDPLRVLNAMGRLWDWWRTCLLASLPPDWRGFLGGGNQRIFFLQQRDQLLVRVEVSAGERELARLPLVDRVPDLGQLLDPKMARRPRWWILPEKAGIRRRFWLPATAARHLRQVVGFEIARQTPFSREQVWYDFRTVRTHGSGRIEVELAVVKKSAVDHLLADETMVLAGVDIARPDGEPSGFNFLPPADRRRASDPARRWDLLLVGVTLVGLVATAAQLLGNRRMAADALEEQLLTAAPRARLVADQRSHLAALVTGAMFLDSKRAAQPTVTEIWKDVTVRLPEGTWLEKLSIEGGRLHLMGLSDDVSSLVRRLEGSPLWRKPALTGALQSDAGSGRSRFTLTAELIEGGRTDGEVAGGGDVAH